MPSTTPQDHKPAKGEDFTFHSAGKKHKLPPASEGMKRIPGRYLRNAALGDGDDQTAYMFALLEACQPSKTALDALYDLPQGEMMDVLQAWGEHSNVGESSGSSD